MADHVPAGDPFDLDVVAVGNAIVDVLVTVEDSFLTEHGLHKGSMALVDTASAEALYAAMGPGVESSGGSAANTAVGVASLGGTAGFVGRVRDDQLGAVFAHDIRASGVAFETAAASDGSPSARCLILVSPDAERTMNTYLGAAGEIEPDDVDPAFIARGTVTYCEGYLWDTPSAKAAMEAAMDAARQADRTVAFTLSDGFCVDRHRAEFLALIDTRLDVVFANEAEICSLFEVDAFDEALRRVRGSDRLWVLTRSAKGSVVVAGDDVFEVPAQPVEHLVDTTGAGDLFAAGFLYGLTHGMPYDRCAEVGSVAAAEVISHVGARPLTPLATLLG
jgi:sugar/nucleoside kinase (ribokinase family)